MKRDGYLIALLLLLLVAAAAIAGAAKVAPGDIVLTDSGKRTLQVEYVCYKHGFKCTQVHGACVTPPADLTPRAISTCQI